MTEAHNTRWLIKQARLCSKGSCLTQCAHKGKKKIFTCSELFFFSSTIVVVVLMYLTFGHLCRFVLQLCFCSCLLQEFLPAVCVVLFYSFFDTFPLHLSLYMSLELCAGRVWWGATANHKVIFSCCPYCCFPLTTSHTQLFSICSQLSWKAEKTKSSAPGWHKVEMAYQKFKTAK